MLKVSWMCWLLVVVVRVVREMLAVVVQADICL
jgi:hypothetical protein